jgi:predicted ATP-binding protein involved in virulence
MGFGVSMRIKQVSVKGLFGIFDHVIPLNLDERITIIHAPNGYGKTVILKMLNGLFHQQYSDLRKIPYKKFRVEFEDDSYLEVSKHKDADKKLADLVLTVHHSGEKEPKSFNIRYSEKDMDMDFPRSMLEEAVPGLIRISSKMWLYGPTGENLTSEEVFDQFHDSLPGALKHRKRKRDAWLDETGELVNIYLIESQRLLSFTSPESARMSRKFSTNFPLPTVNAYSNELVQQIRERLTEYATVAQSLDRSFPTRVLKQQPSEQLTDEALRSRLNGLEKHRGRLVEVGLLEKDEDQSFPIQSQEIDPSTKNVLTVYIEDVEKKLQVFGDLADKIDLFKRIVNSRFSYKEMTISHEKGFLFKSKHSEGNKNISEILSPSLLSSGEQHELILLYELLFKVKENSLVLIDEPELSLHVGWQVNFLRDLQEVTELAKLDMLIATHSPSLIHDRWDLTVELKGVSQ